MNTLSAYSVRSPRWLLIYEGVDITTDVSNMVLSVTYIDRLGGSAGELELGIEDHAQRWQGPWYPVQGDRVNLMIGYESEALLPCGDFQVDELELNGPPDVLHMRCLAAWITPASRTANSVAYENQTLLQIATTIAAKYGWTVVGAADALNVMYARITQKHETDLAFLKRLALTHAYEFTVRGNQLVFYSRASLESQPAVATVTRQSMLRFKFKAKSHRIYEGAEVSYQYPLAKELITQRVPASVPLTTADTLKVIARCENGQQALLKARGALHEANVEQVVASLTMPGSRQLCAGNNLAFSGFGAYDGTYIIQAARHNLTRASGYTTQIEACRVGN